MNVFRPLFSVIKSIINTQSKIRFCWIVDL